EQQHRQRQQAEQGGGQMQIGQGFDQVPDFLVEMLDTGMQVHQSEEILPLADENDDGDAGGKTDDDRVRNVFDDAAQPRQTHDQQDDTSHQGRDLQALDTVFGRDTGEDDDEGAGRACDL